MKNSKKDFKQLIKQPIMWILIATITWLIIGLLLGIFYDFFFLFGGSATFNTTTGEIVGSYGVFNERIYVANPHFYSTQLSVLHTHTLVLGFVVNLILLGLEKLFNISEKKRFFISSFALYNFALFLVILFMMIRGLDWVLNIEYEKVKVVTENNKAFYKFVIYDTNPYKTIPAAITAVPHVLMAVAFAHYLVCLYRGVTKYIREKKINKENQNQEITK